MVNMTIIMIFFSFIKKAMQLECSRMCRLAKSLYLSLAESNIWYLSDSGSDNNDCHSESEPCKNLQTVLDRATDGADIYVTSDTLSLDVVHSNTSTKVKLLYYAFHYGRNRFREEKVNCCTVNTNISYTISSIYDTTINVTCSG